MTRRLVAAGLMALAMGNAVALAPPTPQQVTKFFRAVQLDDSTTVREMVGTTVNANELNPLGGEPALVLAIREGARDVVRTLLRHPGTDLERKAVNGNTALMMAAFKRDADTVEALLAKGARVNQSGWTALHYAAAAGDDAIATLLLAKGARIDALSPRASGSFSPLMMAAREGHESTARLLLAKGAKAGLKNTEGKTAARLARDAGREALAKSLEQTLERRGR